MTDRYQVKLDGFEGPLDLLLHLINRYEIDIYDIPVSTITEQYMNYIHTLQELELNIASEYLVMAASLLAMKSQMLLPAQQLNDDYAEDEEEDPREELIQRLIEYKKFKGAAESLKQKEEKANRVYTRAKVDAEDDGENDEPLEPGEVSMLDMLDAVNRLLKQTKSRTVQETKIKKDEISIQMRMDEILDKIKIETTGTRFHDLFEEKTKPHIVVTFIAVLELMKNKDITCVQPNHFDELVVYKLEEQA
ncbi:segregation/condensation protein A [Halobacillus sp. Marseille-Q1614]|uniref:segregation/condensation protein A n=1 Tax=Halobacillus sp. Marseille-Q1614 TaxID=2709134 RepID=UPI00156E495E|nr:segregation/condensation protein A [Halobacillus sp. Marseille-Q1614]